MVANRTPGLDGLAAEHGLAHVRAISCDLTDASAVRRLAAEVGRADAALYLAANGDPAASADIVGATVDQPSCFIAGAADPVRTMIPGVDSYADPGAGCTDFRGSTIIEAAGHWVHQEAPAATNAAIDEFLATL